MHCTAQHTEYIYTVQYIYNCCKECSNSRPQMRTTNRTQICIYSICNVCARAARAAQDTPWAQLAVRAIVRCAAIQCNAMREGVRERGERAQRMQAARVESPLVLQVRGSDIRVHTDWAIRVLVVAALLSAPHYIGADSARAAARAHYRYSISSARSGLMAGQGLSAAANVLRVRQWARALPSGISCSQSSPFCLAKIQHDMTWLVLY